MLEEDDAPPRVTSDANEEELHPDILNYIKAKALDERQNIAPLIGARRARR
jgi:hypothetical protein